MEAGRAAFVAGQSDAAAQLTNEAAELAPDDALLQADVAFARWHLQSEQIGTWNQLYPAFVASAEGIADLDPARAARMLQYAFDYKLFAFEVHEARMLVERAWQLLGGTCRVRAGRGPHLPGCG